MNALLIFAVAVLLTAGCSPAAELPGCVDEEPSALGRACEGDGECGNWLVCDSSCALPPATSGEGGTTARIVGDGDPIELRVEVARGDLARARGLAHRPCIVDGWGLIIEYPSAGDHLITTESMRFALDIAMVGDDGVIHTVHRDAPAGGKALYGAELPVVTVLEVPADTIALIPGARLEYD